MTTEEKKHQRHHKACGEVGETGEHGDLGSNAIDHPDRLESIEGVAPSGSDLDAAAAEATAQQPTAAPVDHHAKIKASLIAAGVDEKQADAMAADAIEDLNRQKSEGEQGRKPEGDQPSAT